MFGFVKRMFGSWYEQKPEAVSEEYERLIGPAPDKIKALAIAKDALARINKRSYECGIYVAGAIPAKDITDPDSDAQRYVCDIEKNCTVCLLGSLLLSRVKLYDDMPFRNLLYDDVDFDSNNFDLRTRYQEVLPRLVNIFGRMQLCLLESWFEGTIMRHIDEDLHTRYPEDRVLCGYLKGAAASGNKFPDKKERVFQALTNFIQHNARLVVQPQPVYALNL